MSGDRSANISGESPRSLLHSYLIFVRDMRGQRREPSIELRTDDIAVLAQHLGVTQEYVVGGLLDLMGATRAQRSMMMAMLAAGALTVVLTGSFVSDLSTDGISVDMTRLADAVQAAATGSAAETSSATDATSSDSPPAITAASTATSSADAVAASREAIETVGTSAGGSAAETLLAERTLVTPSPDVLQSAAAASASTLTSLQQTTEPAESAGGQSGGEQVGSVAQEPASIGVAPDGSLVASVAPPVPAATPAEPVATAELPDGTVVGVAAPPVPVTPATPAEPVATAELPDGTVVGVAAPPIPPPSND